MGTKLSVGLVVNKFARLFKTSLLSLAGLCVIASPVMAGTNSVVVTEFMGDPVVISDYRGEWVELYNMSDETVDMSKWSFQGAVFPEETTIDGKTVFIICLEDTEGVSREDISCDLKLNFEDLENAIPEKVELKDADNVIVDTFEYRGSDVNDGQSTIVDRDNETGTPTEDADGDNVFYQDRVNDYVDGPDEETGTPGDLTVLDLIDLTPGLSRFDQMIDDAVSYGCPYVQTLISDEQGLLTVFAPSDGAIENLPAEELDMLNANLDELCEFVAYHVVVAKGVVDSDHASTTPTSHETLSGDMIESMLDGDDNLVVKLISGKINADQAVVTSADNEAYNGIVHVIDDVLLAQNPAITFNPIITTGHSPQISGTYTLSQEEDAEPILPSEICIIIRINGLPVAQENIFVDDDGTWSIPAGIVDIDPAQMDTLYTAIMRLVDDCCNICYSDLDRAETSTTNEEVDEICCGDLLALTMQRGVVTEPYEEPDDDGEVLPDTDTKPVVPVVTTVVSTKGYMGDDSLYNNNDDSSEEDDDEGITDDQASNTTNDQVVDESADDDGSTWYWWFVGAGTVALVWYMLWRRPDAA